MENSLYWKNRLYDDNRFDWCTGEGNWIIEYRKSTIHPHRDLIIKELDKTGKFESVLELGCNAGPNLFRIYQTFKHYGLTRLAGIDINKDAITEAKKLVPSAEFQVRDLRKPIPYPYQSFDVVLVDAVLMYIPPKDIKKVFDDIAMIAKKAVILVEWYDDSLYGIVKDYHWCRNYTKLLEQRGFNVKTIKLTEDLWPSKIWIQNGMLFVGTK